jgi:hypothetical protein
VARVAPDGAVPDVTAAGNEVRVRVSAAVAPLGPLPWRVTVTAEAVAQLEPAAGPAG